jgi:hypothetical protein
MNDIEFEEPEVTVRFTPTKKDFENIPMHKIMRVFALLAMIAYSAALVYMIAGAVFYGKKPDLFDLIFSICEICAMALLFFGINFSPKNPVRFYKDLIDKESVFRIYKDRFEHTVDEITNVYQFAGLYNFADSENGLYIFLSSLNCMVLLKKHFENAADFERAKSLFMPVSKKYDEISSNRMEKIAPILIFAPVVFITAGIIIYMIVR